MIGIVREEFMMNKNKIIQANGEEILEAIENLGTEEITLFRNLVPKLELDGVNVPVSARTSLIYVKDRLGERKNITIMDGTSFTNDVTVSDNLSFKTGDPLDEKAIMAILTEKEIPFRDIRSQSLDSKDGISKVWLGKTTEILNDAVKGLADKNAIVHQNATGSIALLYQDEDGNTQIIDKQGLGSMIEFEDKVLLNVLPTPHELAPEPKRLGYTPIGKPHVDLVKQLNNLGIQAVNNTDAQKR